jgi:hypothetical protein
MQPAAATPNAEDDRDQNEAPASFTSHPHNNHLNNQQDFYFYHDGDEQFPYAPQPRNEHLAGQQDYQEQYNHYYHHDQSYFPRFTYPRPDHEQNDESHESVENFYAPKNDF